MEANRITEIQRKVTTLLCEERLMEAVNVLNEGIEELSDWELRTRFSEIKTAYGYMLEYLRAGMPDPGRKSLHYELIGKCLILNDEIAHVRRSEQSFAVYSQYRRKYKNQIAAEEMRMRLAENAANIAVTSMLPEADSLAVKKELTALHERLLAEAFFRLWCSTNWKRIDSEEIYGLLTDKEITINDRATLLSAVTLSTLKCFEPQKTFLLCRLAECEEPEISVRALTGLLISLLAYDSRIKYYPELQTALQSLKESPIISKRLTTAQIQLLRCRETQKIDRKMREEIIPAMMKNPHIGSNKLGVDLIKELEEEGQNPEWKKWIEQGKIKDKIEEMSKWQIEGADIYMSTFSQLKRFPFFNEMFNWFRPFDTDVPQVAEVLPKSMSGTKSLLGAICSSRFFCNSDKYSFCFTFRQVPQEQRDMLMQQLTGESEASEEAMETKAETPPEKRAEIIGNQYIQDLYRFFKISHFKNEFEDPFTLSLNILESKECSTLIDTADHILQIFDYLIEKEYYAEAAHGGEILERLFGGDKCNATFYQKMGYCMQKRGDYRMAVDYYTKADIVKPDTLWTIRHIAQCYRMSGEFNSALHYYEAAESLAPDNLSLLLQTGETLAALKRYDEAFARFFKVEYLSPESLRARRAIAWCSFVTGKEEQARKYYEKLLASEKATGDDYLNAGHVEWIAANRERAVQLYKKAKELYKNDNIAERIFADKETLLERGADEHELLLLRDLLY